MTDLPCSLASPDELANLLNGEWTAVPDGRIHHIRADMELIEPGSTDFFLVPELFCRRVEIARDCSLFT
jgi:hypothetical protein